MSTRREAQSPATKIARALSAVLVAVLLVLALAACASSSPTVVTVAGTQISKAEVEHWTKVEAVLSNETIPKSPPPAGIVPDPPRYSACIAYLASHPPLGQAHGQSQAALKRQCQQEYARLKSRMITFLINYQWLSNEAKQHGIEVSDAEAKKALLSFRRKELPYANQFKNYLRYAGMSEADALLVQRDTVLGTKLAKLFEAPGLSAAQRSAAFSAYVRQWTARTSCSAGYVAEGCRQYKGGS